MTGISGAGSGLSGITADSGIAGPFPAVERCRSGAEAHVIDKRRPQL
ncbi:MAG: hypothetical protein ACLTG4_10890 [Oscillospiraceae bacterium]